MSPLKTVVRITNQFDHAETEFLIRRYGLNPATIPEILSLIECAQDFTECAHSGPDGEPDWEAMHKAKAAKQQRSKERDMLLKAKEAHAVMETLSDMVQELQALGYHFEIA